MVIGAIIALGVLMAFTVIDIMAIVFMEIDILATDTITILTTEEILLITPLEEVVITEQQTQQEDEFTTVPHQNTIPLEEALSILLTEPEGFTTQTGRHQTQTHRDEEIQQ